MEKSINLRRLYLWAAWLPSVQHNLNPPTFRGCITVKTAIPRLSCSGEGNEWSVIDYDREGTGYHYDNKSVISSPQVATVT